MRCSAVLEAEAAGELRIGRTDADARKAACCWGAATRAPGGVTGVGGGITGIGGAVVGGICVRELGGGVVADTGRVGSGL